MLKRQIMLLKTTAQFYLLILKILAKKLVFSIFVPTVSGIASVSHPSLIISRAPKHEARFVSKSLSFSTLFLSTLLTFGPKKLIKHFSILKRFEPPPREQKVYF